MWNVSNAVFVLKAGVIIVLYLLEPHQDHI